MPLLTDRDQIRAILETDRNWAAYALGDLSPGFFEQARWYGAVEAAPALVLLFHAFSVPVLFTFGAPEAVRAIMDEISDEPKIHLSIRPEILAVVQARYTVRDEAPMWRMILDPKEHRYGPSAGAVRLGSTDREALEQLYADGRPTGEAPDFFSASMLEQGVYFGIREDGVLVAAAGTHVVAPSEGVGAVGNVYTRRDRRGRGLAARVTGAVAGELMRMGLRTVVLNVAQQNAAAVRTYERIGFARYCTFYEGMAVRPQPWLSRNAGDAALR